MSSYDSFWVQNELDRARENGIPIFPLLLEGRQWLAVQVLQYVDVRDKSLPPEKFYKRLASVTPRKKVENDPDELKELESQAIQFELLGKFWDALRIYYQIKRIDPLFPGIDNKIKQLEYETRPKPKPRVTKPVEAKKSKPSFKINSYLWIAAIGVIGIIVFLVINSNPKFIPSPANTPVPTSIQTSIPSTPALTETPITTITPQPTQTPIPSTPTPGIGSTMISPKDGMTLMYVPAGNFTMGSNDFFDTQPFHTVYLDAFWIDQTDITNKMYALCVTAGACKPPTNTSSYTRSSYYGNSQFDNYPVIYVDWSMADVYCKWAGRQLPTEAQWEKAARGTDGHTYPWGNSAPHSTLLNYNNVVGDTTEVGKYQSGASPYGALDMAGNVYQWVADWYSDTYYQSSPSSNPLGPSSGRTRVLRGGPWYGDNSDIHSARRSATDPASTDYDYNIGFRCSLSAKP